MNFERIVSIDWSGAGTEKKGARIAVCNYSKKTGKSRIVPPTKGTMWSRETCRNWLCRQLKRSGQTLFLIDFGFSLPWGAQQSVFGVKSWRAMIDAIDKEYTASGTARAMAKKKNLEPQFNGHGPYRFNDSRSDYVFYRDNDIAYYRLTELIAPQALSQWYLGSGATVGFHTITGLSALSDLLRQRDANKFAFKVWPFEALNKDEHQHIFAESYPALFDKINKPGGFKNKDEVDAWRVLEWAKGHLMNGTLDQRFAFPNFPMKHKCVKTIQDQIDFEGCILGLV